MAHLYVCDADACTYQQETPLAFTVTQHTDEEDDDGGPVTVELHLCSGQCLADYAMGLTLDFEGD